MPRYSHDIKEPFYDEDFRKMFDAATNAEQRTLIALLWTTGARPSELKELAKEDITFIDSHFHIRIRNKKQRKEGKFAVAHRTLDIEYSKDAETAPYLDQILDWVKPLPDGARILPKTVRWQEKVINKLSEQVLGKKLTCYHARHSLMTHLAGRGLTIDQLMYFKGASDPKSVGAYISARPVVVGLELQKRKRFSDPPPQPNVSNSSELSPAPNTN